MSAFVTAVSRSAIHSFSKKVVPSIRLIAGRGVEGDAHLGSHVRHRRDSSRNPRCLNRRQVHLIHLELLEELTCDGFAAPPGALGENITTQGLDLPALPKGTRLAIGSAALLELTGLRAPCRQMDRYQKGLPAAVMTRNAGGRLVSKAGVMAVVLRGGEVQAGDTILVHLPLGKHDPLHHV